ncbi:hypothetical protein F5B20DRAFT_520571 [Whalleya microplaca]|nr:hypothetical protein F5B20DRAFT_520571 [Whalleya microplaca]
MDALRGSSPSKNAASSDSPEQLLDSFKAAALSVTKLYKTSAAAQAKARADGYQDCLDDLLAFLDKRNLGLSDGEGWQIRRWATERLDGKDAVSQGIESEDEVDKTEGGSSSPELHRSNSGTQLTTLRNEPPPPMPHQTSVSPVAEAPPQTVAVPTQETFTFQSPHPYPQDSYLNLANLDLSDASRSSESTTTQGSAGVSIAHPVRSRCGNKRGTRPRPTNLQSGHLGKGAGQKRSINFAELFDVGSLGFGKDVFGRDGKRTRHT